MNVLLHSKKVRYGIHALVIAGGIWFLFPNLFTHRNIPRWPVFPNASVEGVDSNNNNLRDDVEIRLHRKIDNDEEYRKVIRYAAAIERRLHYKANTRSEGLEFFRNQDCMYPGNSIMDRYDLDEVKIAAMIFNTKQRIDKDNENVMFITGSGVLSEYLCGSTHDLSDEFEKYMIRPGNK